MKIIAVNLNSDLYLDKNGQIAILTDLQAVVQACEQAAKTQLGEIFLQTTRGVPNFQTIWNGNPNVSQFQAVLRKILRSVKHVIDVRELNTTFSNNVLGYTATIVTEFGSTALSGAIS